MSRLLIGGYSGDKGQGSGISVVEDGRVVATVPAQSPSWIARHPELPVLYAVEETDEGRVHAWRLEDGRPAEELGSGDTGGSEPAHLAVDTTGRFLITANYSGGSVSVNYLDENGQPHLVENAPLPWSYTIVTTLPSMSANIVAQGDTGIRNIRCRVIVDGQVRDDRTINEYEPFIYCLVKSV